MEEKNNYVVITVSSVMRRDKLIRQIYKQLTLEPSTVFTIQQDRINRIKVFHNVGDGVKVLVRTYLVIIIPVLVDLSPLDSLYGSVDFCLDETIGQLTKLVNKLQLLKGHKVIKGNHNVKSLEQQLAGLLS
ncbi:MAG TPA: hypothetical protein PLA71_02480 [Saccharofermentans sp.]|jgi:hypothetical protein|nr:hypothetical protein [Saccharofermentans sp.]